MIPKKNWAWFWSGNWPLLDVFYDRDKDFFDNLKSLIGRAPFYRLDFFEGHRITSYHLEQDCNKLNKAFRDKLKKDSKSFENNLKPYKKKVIDDLKKLERICSQDLSMLPNKKLASDFIKARKCFVFNRGMDFYCWYFETFFTPDVEKIISKKTGKTTGESYNLIISLTSPWKKTKTFEEKNNFFQLLLEIKKNKALNASFSKETAKEKILKKDFPLFYKKFLTHLNSYSFIPVLVNNPPLSMDFLLKELSTESNKSLKEIQKDKAHHSVSLAKNKKNFHKAIKLLKPSSSERQLINDLLEAAFIRTETNIYLSLFSFKFRPMLEEIAKRLHVSVSNLKLLTPQEIVQLLREDSFPNKNTLIARNEFTALLWIQRNNYLFTGKKARKLFNLVSSSDLTPTDFLTGIPASLGKAIGTAKVLTDSSKIGIVEKGDILIAPATSIDFVPAMKKASAIITEFGGITSHAAIVSRELNIPCIVGVSNATKLLSSGERIEVNAVKGIIKRIK